MTTPDGSVTGWPGALAAMLFSPGGAPGSASAAAPNGESDAVGAAPGGTAPTGAGVPDSAAVPASSSASVPGAAEPVASAPTAGSTAPAGAATTAPAGVPANAPAGVSANAPVGVPSSPSGSPAVLPVPAALAHAVTGARYWLPRQSAPATPAAPPAAPPGGFDAEAVRRDFPQLHREVNGRPLVWLDNGATTLKPRQVTEAVAEHYAKDTSNVHRGAHTLAKQATQVYEEGREESAKLLGTKDLGEIVFVRGTTEAVNLVAQSWGRANLGVGDEILVSAAEHHSNLVPWQLIAKERRARVRPIPLLPDGTLDQDAYRDLLSNKTKLVALTHASNVLGTVPPVAEMTALAHRYGARVLVDGAQAVSHFPVDVTALDADFYAFSGHKIFAPTGIGVLFGKREVLEAMPPWQGGGNMIDSVSFDGTTYAPLPHRLEAGTGHIAGVAGLRAALRYLGGLDRAAATAHEEQLTAYAMGALATVPGLQLLGTAPGKIGVLTFLLAGADPIELAGMLDQQGIAVRAGHHCAQPALAAYGATSAVRASLALYNTVQDVDALVAALQGAARS